MTIDESRAVLEKMDGMPQLVAQLQYGSGLRLLEALTLRVQNLDFGRHEIMVRDPKGRHDRRTMLPDRVGVGLHEQLV